MRGRSNGAQRDGVPKHERAVPFVIPLVRQRSALCFIQLPNRLDIVRVPSDESGPTEQSGVLSHIVRLGKSLSIGNGLLGGGAFQRILHDIERDRLPTARWVGQLRLLRLKRLEGLITRVWGRFFGHDGQMMIDADGERYSFGRW